MQNVLTPTVEKKLENMTVIPTVTHTAGVGYDAGTSPMTCTPLMTSDS